MANIKVELDYPINDGMSLTFKAPCDCTAVTGLKIYYPSLTDDTSTTTSKTFTFKDAHGNNLSDIGNLFTSGAYIKVILDTTNSAAYIQNSDTNGYLENKFNNIAATDINSGILPVIYGGTGVSSLDALATALGAARIQTGSYVGTGTYGASNPNSLTFSFVPKLVWIHYACRTTNRVQNLKYSSNGFLALPMSEVTTSYVTGVGFEFDGNSTYKPCAKKSSDGKTLYWYHQQKDAAFQGNSSDTTYYWVAFG